MSMYDQKQVEQLRKRYPKGTRLCLDFMDEPGMPPGLQGTVAYIDDAGQIHMHWENGRSLALIPGEDSFHRIDGPANEVPKSEKRRRREARRGSMETCGPLGVAAVLPVVWWAGAITACAIKPDTNLLQILQVLTENWISLFYFLYAVHAAVCVHIHNRLCVRHRYLLFPEEKLSKRGGAWLCQMGRCSFHLQALPGQAVHPESHFNPELPHGIGLL